MLGLFVVRRLPGGSSCRVPALARRRGERRRLLALVAAAAVLSVAGPAEVDAHHFKGLPHFNYFENYPQIPQEEFVGQAGRYEFSLVLYDFQGLDRQEMEQPNDARLFLIAFDLLANKVYGGPARLEILDGDVPLVTSQVEGAQEENVYHIRATLPPTGDYSLRVSLLDVDLAAEIPFALSSQKVNWGKWVGAGLLVLLAIAAVGARRARVVQDRRAQR